MALWVPFNISVREKVPTAKMLVDASAYYPQAAIVDGWPRLGSPAACLDITVHAHVFGRPYGAIALLDALEAVRRAPWCRLTSHAELERNWEG